MIDDWQNSINQFTGTQRVNDITEYIKYDGINEKNSSPIDEFYK